MLEAAPVYGTGTPLEGELPDPYPSVGEAPPVPVDVALTIGPPGFVPFEYGAPVDTEQMLVSLAGKELLPRPVPEPG